jgi:hypothetical protein
MYEYGVICPELLDLGIFRGATPHTKRKGTRINEKNVP